MKKLLRKLNEWFTWLTSPKVLDAINNGATYEQVEAIVEEEMRR